MLIDDKTKTNKNAIITKKIVKLKNSKIRIRSDKVDTEISSFDHLFKI
jgi:hypothetical protein